MTADYELLPWQQSEWQKIAPALRDGQLAHALLMTGAPGVGKRHMAGVLARALTCAAPRPDMFPCGQCRSCVQLTAGSHPDTVTLEPAEEGGVIKIDPVRQFVHTLHLTSQYGRGRIGWIDPADRMTTSAANSLLKALEEPPEGCHILLITERPRAVLPTIRSRSQRLRFSAVENAQTEAWLAQKVDDATALLPLSQGAPMRAMQLSEAGIVEAQNEWFEGLSALMQGKRDPVSVADAWMHDETGVVLDWLYLVCADVLKRRVGADPGILLFNQHLSIIDDLGKVIDLARFRQSMSAIVEARRLQNTQIDNRLNLESLCINLLECRASNGRTQVT